MIIVVIALSYEWISMFTMRFYVAVFISFVKVMIILSEAFER